MIKATELRCGNHIQFAEKMQPQGAYGDPGPYMTVYGIVEQVKVANNSIIPGSPWEEIWLESFMGPHKPEKLAGIPLTTAILGKLGFEYGHGRWEKNNIRIGDFSNYDGKESKYRLDEMDAWLGYKAPEIKYVHQLQNLYLALTGEELTIKL